ncbi:MAG: hypothetical protein IT457_03220 [Planctomycetes bacterium]|nr:hypothetical protein [Planctomycetota bacterium]
MESPATGYEVRWFAANCCVIERAGECQVFVAGSLIGAYFVDDRDRGPRNVLAVTLGRAPGIHLGHLARAFGISDEYLRLLRRKEEAEGIGAVITGRAGAPGKLTRAQIVALHAAFAAGATPAQARAAQPRRGRVSYQTIWREYRRWLEARAAARPDAAVAPPSSGQLLLFTAPTESAADVAADSDMVRVEALVSRPVTGGRWVQHLGTWIMLGLCQREGLHEEAARVDDRPGDGLRVALDATIAALAIGERCVEGVRRLGTPSAPLLLRADHTPTASGVRRRLARLGEDGGGASLHGHVAARYLAAARTAEGELAVFYVDNHLRPYTGDHVVRRGWRMQDKRVRPGVSDYYVHDEDGRPVLRVDVPSHDSLTQWLAPIARDLRAGLGDAQRILLAFDRAGSFPEELSALRDAGYEWVTYERKGYPLLAASAFRRVVIHGEKVGLHEDRLKNLGKGRGRVRRIAVLVGERQINFVASSRERAERLVEILWDRWLQENAFKHGVERWGLNQLDGRKVELYPDGTIIPNPLRRRLDRALRLARSEEGDLRNRLAADGVDANARSKLEAKLHDAVARRLLIERVRPHVPPQIAVEESELAGVLVRHTGELKAVVDTIRVVCANAEADLAASLAPHLAKPTEAKKMIGNVLSAPGRVVVTDEQIRVHLAPAATRGERRAIAALLAAVSDWKLTLPGDLRRRPMHFQTQVQ